jgi:hypothetical protein
VAELFETEARHYLREALTSAISMAMCQPGCTPWDVAEAVLDAGELTWDYRIEPKPQLATFRLIITTTDADGDDR